MAFAYFDRVKETTTTTGTGVVTLAGAVLGFQAFSARYANNDTLHYVIFHAASGAWEVGFGTWLTGNQLQRTTVLASSNADAAVNFAAGTKEVFVQAPASIPSLQGAHFFSVANATARDAIPATTLRLGALARLLDTGAFYSWNGSAWVLFAGFAPTGSAAGQTQVWNGSAWVAGALDLADPDSHTGTLGAGSGGTGIAGAGGTANRVLLTTDGSSWGAALVDLATMVTGTLAAAALGAAVATSVFGRSAGTGGTRADIQTTVDGQTLRRAGGVLGFGALDLADPDAVVNLLPGTNVDPAFGTGNVSTTGTVSAGKATLTPAVETSGSPYALRVTGAAHTTLAASTQAVDLDFNLGRTVQFATGALASQRAARFTAPTYAFAGASTLTDAATVAISGAPAAGTNATLTNSYALWVEAGVTRLGGGLVLGLPAGSGSSVASCAATGNIRGSRGTFPSSGGTGFQISVRNNNDTGDIGVFAWDSVNSIVSVGAGTGNSITHIDLASAGDWRFRNSTGTTLHSWSTTAFTGTLSSFNIDSTTVGTSAWTYQNAGAATGHAWTFFGQAGLATGGLMSMTAGPATDSVGTCTGGAGVWQAGAATGSTATHIGGAGLFAGGDATGISGSRTGGSTIFRSGTGATDDGDAFFQRGNNIGVQLVKPSGGLVVGLVRTTAVTATQMPANSGNGVIYLGARTTAPTAAPVGGLTMYATSSGELVTVSTDAVTLCMKLGNGTNGVEIKAGGPTDDMVRIITTAGATDNVIQFSTGFLNFDASAHASGSVVDLRYRSNTYFTMSRNGGVALSFFGATAALQSADPVALTAATGAASNTIADVGITYSQGTLNDNFKSLATKYNALRTLLRSYGLAA